tara:strand:+ start:450 stop:989 length:540 start_codon:yes stop_codon:yes gene_type:complete
MIPRSHRQQEDRLIGRFLSAFESGIGRETHGRDRALKISRWRRSLASSGVTSASGASGPVYPLIPLIGEEHPEICVEALSESEISGQIRCVVRALWLTHLLSGNTSLSGWSHCRARHYGPDDIRAVAEYAVEMLRHRDAYEWILSYGAALCRRWTDSRGKDHKCAGYIVWFLGLDTPIP